MTKQELNQINDTISPLLKKGQSLPTICVRYRAGLPVADHTIHSYIDTGLLGARNTDLRRKLRRSGRKKSGPIPRVDRKHHMDRTYKDYLAHITQSPDTPVYQVDSVVIHKGDRVILTILLTTCDLQLMFLRERNTASSVTETFQDLRRALGKTHFRMLSQVIVTDCGNKFTDPVRIETDLETGTVRCRVFHCDPMNSNQKSNCERNHELIRYITPRNQAKEYYTEEEIREMMNHINLYPRKERNGQVPTNLPVKIYDQEAAELLGLRKIPSSSVHLTSAPLKK